MPGTDEYAGLGGVSREESPDGTIKRYQSVDKVDFDSENRLLGSANSVENG